MSDRGWRFEQGDTIVPDCTVLAKLGGGNAYEAYLSFDERLLSRVVVKIVRPQLVADSGTLRGLDREMAMLGRLSHPVIVRAFHGQASGDRPYVALEHLDGPRLSTLMRRFGTLPLAQLLPLAMRICSALHYLRMVDVVHLDVKPSNIIMGPVPRLIDFSIARDTEAAVRLDHVVGTDRYMAPEQCDPPRTGQPGPASDMWGLGVTLYEAIMGSRPFPDGSREPDAEPALRWPQLAQQAPRVRSAPDEVADAVSLCLARDSAARPEPREVFEVLEPVVARLPRVDLGRFRPRR